MDPPMKAFATTKWGDRGSALLTPADFDEKRLVRAQSGSPAVACFNIALAVLADASWGNSTSPLSIAFGNGVVTLPLLLTRAAGQNGIENVKAFGSRQIRFNTRNDAAATTNLKFAATGSVRRQQRALVTARFDENGSIAATGTPVLRTSCTVRRIRTNMPAVGKEA